MHEVFSYLRQNTYIFPLFLFKATDPYVGDVRRSILHLDLHMHVATRSVIMDNNYASWIIYTRNLAPRNFIGAGMSIYSTQYC